jgi:hypothetical protein
MKTRLFDILTLSANHKRLNDPITILTGGVAVLSQLFPNIFGGARKRLTESDWLQLIPGAGYWSTKLRNYLKTRIQYDTDFTANIQPFTLDFVSQNHSLICPRTYTFQNPPGNNPGGGGSQGWLPCYQSLLVLLQKENQTGGQSPVGITPGGYGGTIDYSTILPLAVGAFALVLLMKSKKRA